MLLTETRKFDIATKVLDPSAEAPCRIGSNTFVQGSLTDFDTVYQFGKDVQVLTIEIENVNVDALESYKLKGCKYTLVRRLFGRYKQGCTEAILCSKRYSYGSL